MFQVDDMNRGWLNAEDTAIALRGVNNRLTGEEEEYLYRVSNNKSFNRSISGVMTYGFMVLVDNQESGLVG